MRDNIESKKRERMHIALYAISSSLLELLYLAIT